MKRTVLSLAIVSLAVLALFSLQGCVVPFYDGDGRGGDHRGPGPGGPTGSGPIAVLSGTYGGNCRAGYGNATNHLRAVCDGRQVCDYVIDFNTIGDPAPGCFKDYVAEWQCGNNPKRFGASIGPEAGSGKVIRLRCAGR
jgi:hypothetical protein